VEAHLSRDEWLDWVFAGAGPGDFYDVQVADLIFSVADDVALGYVTEAFERAPELIGRFSDEELCGGLWFLVHDSGFLAAPHLSVEERLRAIRTTAALYRDLFEPRCTSALSHLDEAASPLNGPCYMWWDIGPFFGGTAAPLLEACVDVMEGALGLSNDARRESALHGLGHMRTEGPLEERRREVLERFLDRRNGSLRPELVAYAGAALSGCVL
jgi:hypothetical protein